MLKSPMELGLIPLGCFQFAFQQRNLRMTKKLVGLFQCCNICNRLISGYAVGFGTEKEKLCKTGEIGPEIHKQCTKTTVYKAKGEMFCLTHSQNYCVYRISKNPLEVV